MYALLCKKLSEEAPNLEPPPGPCTFRRLLLSKCRAEFENRSRATEEFEGHNGPLGAEEEERRQFAKRKMLGNIKFIGELGKLEILAESILHQCIQSLLHEKSRGGSSKDLAEDLECLCQIMKTCGRILDTEKAQMLMNQYFERMALHADNKDLPMRIRFMLQDVIELRQNNWIPRKAASVEGPMPIHQIRDDDIRGGRPGFGSHIGVPGSRSSSDMFSRPAMSSFPLRGPPPLGGIGMSHDKFPYSSGNGFTSGLGRPQRQQQQSFYSSGGNNRQDFGQNHGKQSRNMNNSHQQNFSNGVKDVPPRFKRPTIIPQGPENLDDVSLRPPSSSIVYKQAMAKPALGLNAARQTSLRPDSSPVLKPTPPLLKENNILIKPSPQEGKKSNKKDKGPNKEEVLKKIESIMNDYQSSTKLEGAISTYKEQKVPERFSRYVILKIMTHTLDKNDSDRELASNLIMAMKKESLITSNNFMDAFRDLVVIMAEKEQEIPRIYSYVAGFAASAVSEGLLTLAEISEVTENGAHYPLFLLILQQLLKTQDKSKLTQLFNESKVNLLNMLPEVDRTKERLADILEGRGLSFLFPLLRIQSELWKQLQTDPNPGQFYKWIKENLDPSHHTDPGFINALMTVLLKYITQESTLSEGCDPNTPPDKTLIEKEKTLLEKYKAVLQAFLHEHVDLQVTAVYSLQVFCYSQQFPKGMLLRWFVNLYNLEVVEEEAFLKWKEDITDAYPGKGQALFQVNTWLMWLAEAESEEEDEGDN
ncbi:eukaryotic translation initiation factor 4 gamma 2-like [Schistocerca cancellata]|uniref:eukaryotic translation initiation factor 4 gamma 2-like n=1 Tax=Schistocerca cancellata TaxID=274614 RepID=UPI00211799AD|nr:eukaryotic translation initiation factor 4 gamma 2-like [Schistocerca cancellata]